MNEHPLRTGDSPPSISAVVTCLNEEATISSFVADLIEALDRTGWPYEVVAVNDGSTDGTFAELQRLFDLHPCIHAVLNLMKNSGQAAAMTAGMEETSGDYVLMIDSDGQLFPADLSAFITAIEHGADFVNGYRMHRRDSWARKIPSLLANIVMRRVADHRLRDFGCNFRVVDQRLPRAFRFGPRHILSIPLLVSRTSRIAEIPVRHRARPRGESGWTIGKLCRYQADNMILLLEPVYQWAGLAALVLASLLVLRVALDAVAHFTVLRTVSTGLLLNAIIASSLLLAGLICISGEYVVRCHRSVLASPAYVVRERLHRQITLRGGPKVA